jgi:hypothetical protein
MKFAKLNKNMKKSDKRKSQKKKGNKLKKKLRNLRSSNRKS